MKTYNFLGGRSLFIFVVLFCLFLLWGCGSREDGTVNPIGTLTSDEFKWPRGTTGELWELTDADVAELLAINPRPDWSKTEASELHNNYYFSQLLKQFGDIPEVRYIIAFLRKPGKNVTREQAIAYSEANYRLFPNEKNLEALQVMKALPVGLVKKPDRQNRDEERKLAKEDPDTFVELQRERFISKYGDIPEVHTYIEILRKFLKGQPLTDEDRLVKENITLLFQRLDAQREDDNN